MERIDMDRHIRRIRSEYAGAYQNMHWLSPAAADAALRSREELITDIFTRPGTPANWHFAGTKLFTHALSPGCRLCGEGRWSCLFINGICNANCFYCPSEQKDNGPPVTSTVEFDRPRDYAEYVSRFDIQGVGFSGGEPLMTFDRVVDYLKALTESVFHPLHTWMYTNGLLVTADKLKTLRDSGLKEIRFDLSATGYALDSLEKAVGIIPVVTVEIPAIPEDLEKTRPLVRDLYAAGVNFLNLHQIRCTPFNRPKLVRRGYTFLHGPGVTVLETELTAIELIRYSLENNIALPINYCSFTFRNQFQKAGGRKRSSLAVKSPWEDTTGTGFIRNLSLHGTPDRISRELDRLRTEKKIQAEWHLSEKNDSFSFPARLWPHMDFDGLRLKITYSSAALRPVPSFRYPFTEIPLNGNKTVVIERDNRHPGIWLDGGEIQEYAARYLFPGSSGRRTGPAGRLSPALQKMIDAFEAFSPGLAPYF